MPLRDNIKAAMRCNFEIARGKPAICTNCRRQLGYFGRVHCDCATCIFCSQDCRKEYSTLHYDGCKRIRSLQKTILSKTEVLRGLHEDVLVLFDRVMPWEAPAEMFSVRKDLFYAREQLVSELMREGCRRSSFFAESANKNVMAVNRAEDECHDLLLLKRDVRAILRFYLFTGRLEDLYNMCCFLTQRCRSYNCDQGLDDHDLSAIWNDEVPSKEDMTASYLDRKLGEGCTLSEHRLDTHRVAMCHIFLVKCLLYISMKNLMTVNKHFLENQDCLEQIGEYVGLKKEWLKRDKDWYRNQALEVAHLLHCSEHYHCVNMYEDEFQAIKDYADCFTGSGTIVEAVKMGEKWICGMELRKKRDKVESSSRWTEMIHDYEKDRDLLFRVSIQPVLPCAIERMNSMAGWNAIGMNTHPSLSMSEIVTEGIKVCGNEEDFFYHFFEYMDYGHEYDGKKEEYDNSESRDLEENLRPNRDNSHAITMCLAIERKLCQCYFHQNKWSTQSQAILAQLPARKVAYTADPPPDAPEGAFYQFIDGSSDVDNLSHWPLDVTKVVKALSNKGLTSNKDNLKTLFGPRGCQYLSYQLFELRQEKERDQQSSILPFITRTRFWKEGCVDYDSSLGLKIQYLTIADRRAKLQEAWRFIPMAHLLQHLHPSIEQFGTTFGWNNLGLPHLVASIPYDMMNSGEFDGSVPKRQRHELDGFTNIKEACRHYFDTATLEEAILDFVGTPRVIVLNGNREKMESSGWKRVAQPRLGDQAVQLGRRVAHVYSGLCTVWAEKEYDGRSSSGAKKDSD